MKSLNQQEQLEYKKNRIATIYYFFKTMRDRTRKFNMSPEKFPYSCSFSPSTREKLIFSSLPETLSIFEFSSFCRGSGVMKSMRSISCFITNDAVRSDAPSPVNGLLRYYTIWYVATLISGCLRLRSLPAKTFSN